MIWDQQEIRGRETGISLAKASALQVRFGSWQEERRCGGTGP
jgi:hypothetical protein